MVETDLCNWISIFSCLLLNQWGVAFITLVSFFLLGSLSKPDLQKAAKINSKCCCNVVVSFYRRIRTCKQQLSEQTHPDAKLSEINLSFKHTDNCKLKTRANDHDMTAILSKSTETVRTELNWVNTSVNGCCHFKRRWYKKTKCDFSLRPDVGGDELYSCQSGFNSSSDYAKKFEVNYICLRWRRTPPKEGDLNFHSYLLDLHGLHPKHPSLVIILPNLQEGLKY